MSGEVVAVGDGVENVLVGDRVAACPIIGCGSVSTRKVKTITEELCSHEFSSSTISRIVQRLDEELEEPYPYLILDAHYEKVREDGAVRSQAVLIAIGINWEAGGIY